MKVKALVSFAGVVTMSAGEEREISLEIAKSLLKANYIEEIKKKKASEVK